MADKILYKGGLFVLLVLLFVTGIRNYGKQATPPAESDVPVPVLAEVEEPQPLKKLDSPESSEPEQVESSHETHSLKASEFYYYSTFEVDGVKYYPGEMTQEEQLHTYNMCEKYGLEYELVLALFGAESRWHRDSVSSSGCIGYGQILYRIHKNTMINKGLDVYNSLDNIEYTCFLLASKMSVYGDYNKALMAYKYGNEGANKYFKKGIYKDGYSQKIMAFRDGLLKEKGK